MFNSVLEVKEMAYWWQSSPLSSQSWPCGYTWRQWWERWHIVNIIDDNHHNYNHNPVQATPSDATGLTALAIWILSCLIFVLAALLFFVVMLGIRWSCWKCGCRWGQWLWCGWLRGLVMMWMMRWWSSSSSSSSWSIWGDQRDVMTHVWSWSSTDSFPPQ